MYTCMTTNVYFNNYTASNEQNLVEDLVIEAIQIKGMNMKYMPRTTVSNDYLFGEDPSSAFNDAVEIEMYMNDVDRFGGDGDIFSRFGYEINDTAEITISKKRFADEIIDVEPEQTRPYEGDLIFMPITNAILEVKFVDHEDPFFQHGKQYVYKLKCELFDFNNETFNTNDIDIENIIDQVELNDPETEVETFGDNDEIQTETDTSVSFDPSNPFGVR